MKLNASGTILILTVCAAFAATWPFRGDLADRAANFKMQRPLAGVSSWRVVTEPADLIDLADDTARLVVIASSARSGPQPLPADAVASLKWTAEGQRRIVLAELSVAKLSDAAPGWDQAWLSDPPDWLAGATCASGKTRPTRYWLPGWRNLIYRAEGSALQRLQDTGFDGVYLSDVDAFTADVVYRPSARREMRELVIDLAQTARNRFPGFLVVAESGEALLEDADYRNAIDAVAERDLLARYNGLSLHNALQQTRMPAALLRHLRREGKPVFTLEDAHVQDPVGRSTGELRRRGLVVGFRPLAPALAKPGIETGSTTAPGCTETLSW